MTTQDEQVLDDPSEAVTPGPLPIKRTVEDWAADKGMLPQFTDGGTLQPKNPQPGETVIANLGGLLGSVKPRANPTFWKFAAARAKHAWPQGAELTQAEFDSAVEAATNTPI
jgi:hypothetical protein